MTPDHDPGRRLAITSLQPRREELAVGGHGLRLVCACGQGAEDPVHEGSDGDGEVLCRHVHLWKGKGWQPSGECVSLTGAMSRSKNRKKKSRARNERAKKKKKGSKGGGAGKKKGAGRRRSSRLGAAVGGALEEAEAEELRRLLSAMGLDVTEEAKRLEEGWEPEDGVGVPWGEDDRVEYVGERGTASAPGVREPTAEAPALGYTNALGVTYYLHEGRTKTGKPRYFVAKTIRSSQSEGDPVAIPRVEMPEGYEFTESINGVVSVRRIDSATSKANARVPEADVERVRKEVARHPHLRRCKVAVVKGAIVIHEPRGGMPPELMGTMLGRAAPRPDYEPVMKLEADDSGIYAVFRMTYRGDGGWSYPLDVGPLGKLVSRYVRHVGTEGFFELM